MMHTPLLACLGCNRETDDHRDAATGRVLDGQLAADRVDESPGDRKPEADTGVARGVAQALERLEHASSLRERDPAAPVDDAEVDPIGHRGGFDPNGLVRPEWRTALSTTFATARSRSAGSTSTSGRVSGTSTTHTTGAVAQARDRGRHDLVEPGGPCARARARPPASGSCRAGSRPAC